ncbi:MAG: glycosyltransferase [Lachnospiraceae bacterium]|nr:glycosyltransferase [Lachnospiraceae bacterium]
MFDIDFIIPCYGKSELINKGLASLVTQWQGEYIHVTLVNDCSPNTDCDYQDLVDKYSRDLDIRCIRTPRNVGQGLARQYGVDNTHHSYFMFMDEDDQIGNGLALSIFVGAVEGANIKFNEDGQTYPINSEGSPVLIDNPQPVALVSGPVFEFDLYHTRIIDNTNRVWVNSKLYSREFVNKHNIRFNEAQSRHAEDYYFMSCFFHALDNDPEYKGAILDNNGLYYLWYPNSESQSRADPHYPYMLSGYTMDGSVNILRYMKDKENNIPWTEEIAGQYRKRLLNMAVYSYFTLFAFIRHVTETDYIPSHAADWYTLSIACTKLREELNASMESYTQSEIMVEYANVKNYSDVLFTEPWVGFMQYVLHGCEELTWDFCQLLRAKNTYAFDGRGILAGKGE